MISPSGGLVYHARAHLDDAIGKHWMRTRTIATAILANWLEEIRPQRLVIFGPSAGYLLDSDLFLSRKLEPMQVAIVDPDIVASRIFRWRHRRWINHSTKFDVICRGDVLPHFNRDRRFIEFCRDLKTDTQPTAIVFWGCMGQIDLEKKSLAAHPRVFARKMMLEALAESSIPWASFHDSFSLQTARPNERIAHELEALSHEGPIDLSKARRLEIAILDRISKTCIDHETEWLEHGSSLGFVIPWQLTPRRLHVMHFVSNAPPQKKVET